MKNKKFLLRFFCFLSLFFISNKVDALSLDIGTYTSDDGHKIVVEEGSILYDDMYSLTLKSSTKGSTLTGKLGTDKKSVTFYQINETNIVSGTTMTYKHDGNTVYLYDYTVFGTENTPLVDNDGKFELWRNNLKINSYGSLQDAIDAAVTGDTVKIMDDMGLGSGAYINNKSITIDGLNHNLKGSSWLNSIFFVGESASLNLKDIVLDGDSTGFAVDKSAINIQKGTSTSIPIKSGSDSSDIKRNMSLIISKGILSVDNSKFSNFYVNGDGSIISVLSGKLFIDNTLFSHNRATNKGGALSIGRKVYDNESVLPVSSVSINNCEFKDNYSKNGGALYLLNITKTDIVSTKFINNVVTGGKGAAILVDNQSFGSYFSIAEKLNISVPSLNIDKSIFDGNWVGNDGSAMEIHDSSLKVTNTIFTKNVGIHNSSSCGCISLMNEGKEHRDIIIDNCIFEENLGSASVIADHGSSALSFKITNTQFLSNKAVYNSFLIYASDFYLENCLFDNEHATRGIIDIRVAVTPNDIPAGYKQVNISFKDVIFKNSQYDVTDILIRKYSADSNIYPVIVTLEGDVEANIDLWEGNELIINGNHKGVINVGQGSNESNVTISTKATLENDVNYLEDKNLITIILYGIEKKEGYFWESRKYVYADTKTYVEDEFFMLHNLTEDGYKLSFYTDSIYTNKWDYNVTGNMTIYGKWEEHTHSFNGNYVVYKNAIYEQCECGYLGKKISLSASENNIYNGKEFEVVINNELGIDNDKYNISYFVERNGNWEKINNLPKNEGKYKAILTFNNNSIEQVFNIVPVNPNTGDNIGICISLFFMSLISLIGSCFLLRKNI